MTEQRRIPPARVCQDCGRSWRAWSGILCPACVRLLGEQQAEESFRDFWRRVIGPGRGAAE